MPNDPREIPVLTDAIEGGAGTAQANLQSAQLAIVTQTLKLAEELLHQAAKDMEASLFERVFDRLKTQLPELVERIMQEQLRTTKADLPQR